MRIILWSGMIALAVGCNGRDRRDTGGGVGDPCPCASGLVCDAVRDRCVLSADAGPATDAGSSSDAGSGTDAGTTTGTADCDGACARAGASGCTNFDGPTCVGECQADEMESAAAGCSTEYEALVMCLTTATYTCDGSNEPATADCEPQARTWVGCLP